MKIKTIYTILLLSVLAMSYSCGSARPDKTPGSVEEAEKQLAKQQKSQQKIAKKEQKIAYKRYWGAQSKQAKKSIKANKKAQKRIARNRKKGGK